MQFFPNNACINSIKWKYHIDAKSIENKLDGIYTRMPRTMLNNSR